MRPMILALAVALATAIAAPQSQAAPVLLIDTYDGSSTTRVNRPGRLDLNNDGNFEIQGIGFGSRIRYAPANPLSTWTVDRIEVNTRLSAAGDMRFVIFEIDPILGPIEIGRSAKIPFAADTTTDVNALWKASGNIVDPILGTPVILTAGDYDIGAIFSSTGQADWLYDANAATGNVGGFSSLLNPGMPEFEQIDNPEIFQNVLNQDGAVRLYAVPEPSSLALCGVGLIGMAGSAIRRRRTKKAAAAIPAT